MSNRITDRQAEVLAFIVNYLADNDPFSPSIKEIADHFGITSSSAHQHVKALLDKGFLAKHDRQPHRNLMITDRIERP